MALVNQAKNTATLTNGALSQKTFGEYTLAELASLTISQRENIRFSDKYIAITNQTKS